ncbi:unnamed protein product, partial [Symbiodinium sp. CCMP2592]
MTFGADVAAPAVGESTADDTVVQSVDSSTEDDKGQSSALAIAKAVPKGKAKSLPRASTPSRPTSTGSRTGKASERRAEASGFQAPRTTSRAKDKGVKTLEKKSRPSSSRSSSARSRTSATRGRDKSMTWNRMVTNQPRDADDLDMTLDTIPARGDASSVATPAIADGPNAYQELTISQQFEASNLAQQMYYRSQVQEYEGVVQTLMDKIKEMQQEDEGSGIRIEELERQ